MFERRRQLVALFRVVPQPVQQLGESPLVRINAAAPLDRFEIFAVGKLGNLLRLTLGAMVAPEVVVIERLQCRIDRNHARAGGVERDGLDMLAGRSRLSAATWRMALTSALHLILVRLRGVIRVFALAFQRILGRSPCPDRPRSLSNSVDAHTQRSKITPATIAT